MGQGLHITWPVLVAVVAFFVVVGPLTYKIGSVQTFYSRRLDEHERRLDSGDAKFERLMNKMDEVVASLHSHQIQMESTIREQIVDHLSECALIRDARNQKNSGTR